MWQGKTGTTGKRSTVGSSAHQRRHGRVWVSYDNGDGKRRSLAGALTGARVALPICKPFIEDVWAERRRAEGAAERALRPERGRELVDLPIDYMSGNIMRGSRRAW